ncbi:helix-turn-helix domain-containing protein [Microbacterium sp. SLBN-146]|uniref:helix-turn-helix domain-containing protein n=1 Tax=Microbacterium sp. SLBN-146 TaxID=2768457 RepID=UPI001150FBCF|nr:helix-turn-helix domain-containing protein [Microbacterium sp. SLBN-146]TQJ30008.1 sugar diacid utilization regulator [Microbacterium sp. SLBN-146]
MEDQRIVEHLAHELRRSVVIVDRDHTVIGVCYRAEDHEMLQREGAASPNQVVREWMHRATRGSRSRVLSSAQSGEETAWITVPLHSDGEVMGWALVAWRPADLSSAQLALIDIAADLLASAARTTSARESRRGVLRNLLDADPTIRRAGLRRASAQRWIDRLKAPAVRALVFDDRVGMLEQLHLAESACRALPLRAEVLRERDDAVFILTSRTTGSEDVDDAIRRWAADRGIALKAVGSAAVRVDDEDLARAAHAATTAAELSMSMPELTGMSNGDSLGGWALLNAVKGQRDLLSVASPAAELLCALGDTQRETVEVYLDEAGHVRAACERLHIHRTTLYYRLDNLPDVVKSALADGMQRSTLHLALKLDRLWAAAGV